jgi:pimeloyl-ACP methyl ester carboxylesterase
MSPLFTFLAFAGLFPGAAAEADKLDRPVGSVESCEFPTQSLPPPFRVPKQYADSYKLFQAGGAFLPEEITVKSAILMGDARMGLAPEATKRLSAGLDQLYRGIAADPLFKNINSALPYCLGDKRPSHGHYFAYYPQKLAADTPVIVFLHGYGGNFLFYTYLLKEEFPEAAILLPSRSGSWHDGTMQYLDDMCKDVKRRKSLAVRRPSLMAISAGGPAGFRLYHEQPNRFSSFVSIASAPSRAIVPKLEKDLTILMVNGKKDAGFPIAGVQSIAESLAERLPNFRMHVVDGDHFFLLSHREETFRVIKAFLKNESAERPSTAPAK